MLALRPDLLFGFHRDLLVLWWEDPENAQTSPIIPFFVQEPA